MRLSILGIFLSILCTAELSAAAGTTCSKTWTNSVSIAKSGSNLLLATTDCPGYDWSSQSTPNTPTVSCMA